MLREESPMAPFQVSVSAIEVQARKPGLIQSFFLESPKVRSCIEGYSLTISGWLIPGEDISLPTLEIITQDKVLKRVRINIPRPDVLSAIPGAADACFGFHCELGILGLGSLIELSLVVRVESKQLSGYRMLTLCMIKAVKKSRIKVESKFQPIQVTAIGRSGTTLLMQILNQHPQILTTSFYPFEVKQAAYWLHFLKVATAPADLENSSHPDNLEDVLDTIGHNPYSHPEYISQYKSIPPIKNFYGNSVVRSIAKLCVEKINQYYELVAQEEKKPEAVYFAEKALPNHLNAICEDIFSKPKEIILTRDFRDMLCSARAFNAKRNSHGFGRNRVNDDFEWVNETSKTGAHRMQQAWVERREHSLHVKYEDLIIDTENEIRKILNYLEVESGDCLPARIQKAVFSESSSMAIHRTAQNPRASIGRWKTDMDDVLKEHCKAKLGNVLSMFGYEV
ncbi:MAG: sulfotransferase [Pseudomonadota bacterium]